jgi:hypothetical protein
LAKLQGSKARLRFASIYIRGRIIDMTQALEKTLEQSAVSGWNQERARPDTQWLRDAPEAASAQPRRLSETLYEVDICDETELKIGSTIAQKQDDGRWTTGPYKRGIFGGGFRNEGEDF